jgi:mRNA interferase HigB
MRVIAVSTLKAFWEQPAHRDSEGPLKTWYVEACRAEWKSPNEIKAQYGNASIVGNNRVVFNVAGDKYRLIVAFAYRMQVAYIKFVGTHSDYDMVYAATVDQS